MVSDNRIPRSKIRNVFMIALGISINAAPFLLSYIPDILLVYAKSNGATHPRTADNPLGLDPAEYYVGPDYPPTHKHHGKNIRIVREMRELRDGMQETLDREYARAEAAYNERNRREREQEEARISSPAEVERRAASHAHIQRVEEEARERERQLIERQEQRWAEADERQRIREQDLAERAARREARDTRDAEISAERSRLGAIIANEENTHTEAEVAAAQAELEQMPRDVQDEERAQRHARHDAMMERIRQHRTSQAAAAGTSVASTPTRSVASASTRQNQFMQSSRAQNTSSNTSSGSGDDCCSSWCGCAR